MFKILSELNLTKLFIVAILLRILIMPFYFHPDMKTYNWQASFLKKGVFNIYTYLVDNKDSLPLKEEFVYFPLTYFFLGTYQIITSPLLGPHFDSWLSDASSQAPDRIGTFRYLFILKFPYLIFDLAIPFLLIKFFDTVNQKRKAFIWWLFNPFPIAIIYFFSNVDIISVTLSLIALLLFQRKKFWQSGLALGISVGFKAYPLVFIPFLLLFVKDIKKLILMLATTILIIVIISIPFWSVALVNSAILSSLTTRIAFPAINIGYGESLMIGVIGLSILFFNILMRNNLPLNKTWYMLTAVLLIIFSSIHFHIQWLLWVMPFLVLFGLHFNKLNKLIWIWVFLAALIPLLYDDKFMNVSLLSGISPLYNLLPTPFLVIQQIFDPFILQGIIHSVILGISLVLIVRGMEYLGYE